MEKEDFINPKDWVIYKVAGKLPNNLKKNGLKFHRNSLSPHRFSVFKNSEYICACGEKDIGKLENEFQEKYTGNNLDQIKMEFRSKYNCRTKSKPKAKIKPRKRKGRNRINSLKSARLNFTKREDRYIVRTRFNGNAHYLCFCSKEDIPIIKEEFNYLKKNRDIDEIKNLFRRKYNLNSEKRNIKKTSEKGRLPTRRKQIIIENPLTINENGMIFCDGKFVTQNQELYDFLSR